MQCFFVTILVFGPQESRLYYLYIPNSFEVPTFSAGVVSVFFALGVCGSIAAWQAPCDHEWPRELWGMQLGSFCRQMRIGDIWAKYVSFLFVRPLCRFVVSCRTLLYRNLSPKVGEIRQFCSPIFSCFFVSF